MRVFDTPATRDGKLREVDDFVPIIAQTLEDYQSPFHFF